MAKKIYCDTNIYLDYLHDRSNLFGRNMGDRAFKVFNRALGCEFEIALSTWNLAELKRKISPEDLKMLLIFLNRKLTTVEHTEEDIKKAKQLSEHFQDALHVILAQKAGASILVTSNISDFLQYRHLIEIKLPQNL